ncbi:hypothetical protein ACI2TP_24155, partial [Ralstonia nicotianae]
DIRQVAWVPLGLATQLRLAFSMFFFPHPAFTPQRRGIFKRALIGIVAAAGAPFAVRLAPRATRVMHVA